MARFTNQPKLLPEDVLDRYKYEIADELGLTPRIQSVGWGDMTSRECGLTGGRIGGTITRVLIRLAEEELAARGGSLPQ